MNTVELPTMKEYKLEAKQLRVNNENITGHSMALHCLANKYGYKNWHTIRPKLVLNDLVNENINESNYCS